MKKLLCVLLFTLTTALSVFAIDSKTISNAVTEFISDKNSTCIIFQDEEKEKTVFIYKENIVEIRVSQTWLTVRKISDKEDWHVKSISYNKKTGILTVIPDEN